MTDCEDVGTLQDLRSLLDQGLLRQDERKSETEQKPARLIAFRQTDEEAMGKCVGEEGISDWDVDVDKPERRLGWSDYRERIC